MARYTGPRNKIARREGVDLDMVTAGSKSHASLLRRMNIKPGQHGAKRTRKQSNFGQQLREKQKTKSMYGVLERQFRRYVQHAQRERGNTGEALLQLLETRLDNIIYRLGLVPTRSAARQLVSHRHVTVNGKIVNIPSYQVKPDEVIALRDRGAKIPVVVQMLKDSSKTTAAWLERRGPSGKLLHVPTREDLDLDINEQLIVEYYSR